MVKNFSSIDVGSTKFVQRIHWEGERDGWRRENKLHMIGIRKLQYDINSYADLVINYALDFVKELYQLGPKRIGLFGSAPIGCLPSQRTLAGGELRVCSEIYNQAAQLMNSKLSSAITSYNNSLNDPKARIVYTDIYNPLLNIILNHDKYGNPHLLFAALSPKLNLDKGCCGIGNLEVSILCNQLTDTCPDDSVYVFWDSYHPTERGY
ncbi:hypothetical protein HYC85_008752 [Camellia sinensis]|uniref:GDSL esterase/lipase n=1 Tax=Camellia sinensis TaxID=4442 RepID=A0A7J7HUZ5_CAMSI|nr:hypothetical protein HYC85_008752 [Camellia sinensis]